MLTGKPQTGGDSNTWAIVGGVVGGLAFLIIVIVIIVCIKKRPCKTGKYLLPKQNYCVIYYDVIEYTFVEIL